jgi:hypothetical protein
MLGEEIGDAIAGNRLPMPIYEDMASVSIAGGASQPVQGSSRLGP